MPGAILPEVFVQAVGWLVGDGERGVKSIPGRTSWVNLGYEIFGLHCFLMKGNSEIWVGLAATENFQQLSGKREDCGGMFRIGGRGFLGTAGAVGAKAATAREWK
jgi:hypothetical protein